MKDQRYGGQNDQSTEIAELLHPHLAEILGRRPIGEPLAEHRQQLAASRILVTGAAGSIGRALSEWLSQIQPEMLVLLDNHENTLFRLRQSLLPAGGRSGLRFVIADVRNHRRVEAVLEEFRPDVVFHLAAYKHVPLAEEWPQEFVQVNVVGTWQLALAAARVGVKKLVYTSTDKAVNPPSVYGATKRAVEILLRGLASDIGTTQFTVVRLVNVVGARGGVIETFAQDILAGNPVRVTDPRMTRYWITMPEALFLLTSAASRPSSGDTLLLDVGQPISVPDMARRVWALLRGSEQDFTAEYVGMRPGERLEEELTYSHEKLRPAGLPGILEAVAESSIHNRSLDELAEEVDILRRLAEDGPVDQLKEQLFRLAREA